MHKQAFSCSRKFCEWQLFLAQISLVFRRPFYFCATCRSLDKNGLPLNT
ncbi:hypothetical protein HMPREF0454_03595 [Hafnia alvei ATCC 51873]|uniref:Uncharacterized protein n=1 Tax=Hafnia alvei ATCC 51873 TaxID=1002364 RepID=G9YAH1_HAFAL|nr:hypothetical protein HMPREF0454_03595 [Hafnia alvei ATCC 51873]